MRHYSTTTNPQQDHYAIGADNSKYPPLVLIQIQENGNQARIPLTVNEARHLAELLTSVSNTIDWLY